MHLQFPMDPNRSRFPLSMNRGRIWQRRCYAATDQNGSVVHKAEFALAWIARGVHQSPGLPGVQIFELGVFSLDELSLRATRRAFMRT